VDSLEEEHYEVLTAVDGGKGYELGKKENIDLIILDVMLPKKNGQDVCRDLRNDGVSTPILMLTSKKQEMDKVLGLELGADDYVTKPFSIRELQARIKALLRRKAEIRKTVEEFSFGNMHVDFKKQIALKKGKPIKLSSKEFEILHYCIQREGEVVTREMLLDEVWGPGTHVTDRVVDNQVTNLRRKIEPDPEHPRYLVALRGLGYRFDGEGVTER